MVQWLRIYLAMLGMRVDPWSGNYMRGSDKAHVGHSY